MLAAALDKLIPGAQYWGSLTGPPTRATYDAIEWIDDRPQPTWTQVQAAMPDALVEARAGARRAIIAYADALTARITARYPAAEVASWPTRAAEAAAIQAGAAEAATPLITALAVASGQTRADIAAAILVKAAAYTAVVVAVSVLREQAEAAVAAAANETAITATLAALKQAADAMAAELGLV